MARFVPSDFDGFSKNWEPGWKGNESNDSRAGVNLPYVRTEFRWGGRVVPPPRMPVANEDL